MKKETKTLEPWQLEDAARLKELFAAREPKVSQAEFGAQHGLGSQGMVWQYLSGHRPLNIKAATAFARGLSVTVQAFSPTLASQIDYVSQSAASAPQHDVRELAGEYQEVVLADPHNPAFYQIPKVQLRLSAGVTGFQTVPEIYDGSKLSVSKNWVDRNGFTPSKLIALSVKGESMEPNLYAGDLVIVNTGDTKIVDGSVYAVNYEGEAVVKRFMRDSGEWWLSSDNPDQQKYRRKRCRDGECLVVGKVVKRETERI